MNDPIPCNAPLQSGARAWIHDAAGVCSLLDILAETTTQNLPVLIDTYRRCRAEAPPPDLLAINGQILDSLATLDGELRRAADKLRAASNRTWELLAEATGDTGLLQNRIPLRDGTKTPSHTPPEDPSESGKPLALVADDELLMREVLADMLENRGYRVERAQHGGEAWNMLQCAHYDLVLLDFRMPVMHGFEVAQRIAAGADADRPRLIGMTVSPLTDEHDQGRAAGMDVVLVKPITG